jgi:hypothetical protein
MHVGNRESKEGATALTARKAQRAIRSSSSPAFKKKTFFAHIPWLSEGITHSSIDGE